MCDKCDLSRIAESVRIIRELRLEVDPILQMLGKMERITMSFKFFGLEVYVMRANSSKIFGYSKQHMCGLTIHRFIVFHKIIEIN